MGDRPLIGVLGERSLAQLTIRNLGDGVCARLKDRARCVRLLSRLEHTMLAAR